jgi:hypothetical protein
MKITIIRGNQPTLANMQTFATNVTCLANWLRIERAKREAAEQQQKAEETKNDANS